MILSFKTKFDDGNPTYFIEKIWKSLMYHPEIAITDKALYARLFYEKFNHDWDGRFDKEIKPKHHTIREDVHDRWEAGTKIHFTVFPRSARMFQFAPVIPCESVQKLEIIHKSEYVNDTIVKVDERILTTEECVRLAWNDGFDNLMAFHLYFSNDFNGKIIHWTDLKY